MSSVSAVLGKISDFIWGVPNIVLLLGAGTYFTCKLKFFQFAKSPLWMKKTLLSLFKKNTHDYEPGKSLSPFQAVATALAATIGTGNIAGVATAISVGGPGAVFWMWMSAILGMMTSYSENLLGVQYRTKDEKGALKGGPMYYIKDAFDRTKKLKFFAKPFAGLYAVFLIFASFGIGNMTQTNCIAASIHSSFGVNEIVIAVILAVVVYLIIRSGKKSISSVAEKIVPFMAAFYIICCLTILVINFRNIPYVFTSIFKNAFDFKAIAGGAGGIAISRCISTGMRRGVFSNEAGLGGCVTVSSCSSTSKSAEQGMWGIFQVFFDTIIICSLTAFVILSTNVKAVNPDYALSHLSQQTQYICLDGSVSGDNGDIMLTDVNANSVLSYSDSTGTLDKSDKYTYTNIMAVKGEYENGKLNSVDLREVEGISLVSLAFTEHLGSFAGKLLSIATVLFAFSTVLGWSSYASVAIEYLFGQKAIKYYFLICGVLAFIGSVLKIEVVWTLSDIFNGLMVIPNVIGLIAHRKEVGTVTDEYLADYNRSKRDHVLTET